MSIRFAGPTDDVEPEPGELVLARFPGVGSLMDPVEQEAARRRIATVENLAVQLEVLRDDIDGSVGCSPEWAGNQYATVLLSIVGDRKDFVDLTFDGWDFDSREVFQINEIRRFCMGFLGRIVATPGRRKPNAQGEVYVGLESRSRGEWEGRILEVLASKPFGNLLGDVRGDIGSRLRVFGCAEQLYERPLLTWVPSPTGRGWVANGAKAEQAIEAAITGKPMVLDLHASGRIGIGHGAP